jgi:hypothetical protein
MFLNIRCLALENIVRRQKYPCENRQRGCLELFSVEHIDKHEAGCVFGEIKCPLHSFKKCLWNGVKNDLKEHVKAEHRKYFLEGSAFTFNKLLGFGAILSCYGELFTYYQEINDGRVYGAVQLNGTSSEASKYKYKCTLRAANDIEKISKTLFVRGSSEDWETIFNSRICLCLDEKTIKHFLEENDLEYTVTLSRV